MSSFPWVGNLRGVGLRPTEPRLTDCNAISNEAPAVKQSRSWINCPFIGGQERREPARHEMREMPTHAEVEGLWLSTSIQTPPVRAHCRISPGVGRPPGSEAHGGVSRRTIRPGHPIVEKYRGCERPPEDSGQNGRQAERAERGGGAAREETPRHRSVTRRDRERLHLSCTGPRAKAPAV